MALVKTVLVNPRLQGAEIAPAFTPGALPSLVIWIDASNSSSVTVISNAVSQINDLSGNGNHMAQATAGNRPAYTAQLNLLNVMTFASASNQDLGCVRSQLLGPSITVASVHKATTLAANAGVFTADDTASNRVCQHRWDSATAPSCVSFPGGSATDTAGTAAPDITVAAHSFINIMDNAAHTSTNYIDGTQNGQSTGLAAFNSATMAAHVGRATTGGTNFWNGIIAEIVVCNAALTSTQRANLVAYFRGKWGTP